MSESRGISFSEYYSDAKQVRKYINERIEHLKQLLEERRLQLNIELDNIESEASKNDEKNKVLIKRYIDYESLTISIFGEEDSKLAAIKSKISTLEQEVFRKKFFLQWKDDTLVNNFEWLGLVAYESNEIYITMEKQFNEEMTPITEENKTKFFPEERVKQHDVVNVEKEKYIGTPPPPKERPRIAKKPRIHQAGKDKSKSQVQITDSSMLTETIYENQSGINQPVEHTYSNLTNEGVIDEDEKHEAKYEILDKDLESQDESISSIAVTSPLEQTSIEISEPDKSADEIPYKSFEEYSDKESDTQDILTTCTVQNKSVRYEDCLNLRSEMSSPLGDMLYNPEAGILQSNMDPLDADDQDYKVKDESRLVYLPENRYGVPEKSPLKPSKSSSSMNKLIKNKIYDLPIMAWGGQGKGLGQLNKPKAVCVSEKGNIFVAEKGNNRVQVFTSGGKHLYMFSEKSGQNEMLEPNGIWVSKQFVYVTLSNQHTIQMYTLQGGFVKKKSKEGKEEGRFKLPCGICGDISRGKIYICDTGNNRIQIFDNDLHFIKVLNTKTPLFRPLDIKVTNSGNLIIVLDRSAKCIHMFKGSGETIKEIIEIQFFPKLINPLYFTIDAQGNILLSDYSSHCIHVFTEEGELVWSLGEAGRGKPFVEPRGLAFDAKGRLITVCKKEEAQVQIFEI